MTTARKQPTGGQKDSTFSISLPLDKNLSNASSGGSSPLLAAYPGTIRRGVLLYEEVHKRVVVGQYLVDLCLRLAHQYLIKVQSKSIGESRGEHMQDLQQPMAILSLTTYGCP